MQGRKNLDDAARAKAPGRFAELADGMVHYQLFGPQDGLPLVLVHGFSTPSFVWAGILPSLAEAGYRVLAYDLFGRGWSDRPDTDYSLALYERQLAGMLDEAGVRGPVYLCGYSMGGLIAAGFAARNPDRVSRLFLIAPAGLGARLNRIPRALKWPVIGPWLADKVMSKRLLADMARPENAGKAVPDMVERYREQMEYSGYMRSLRSTLLHTPLFSADEVYQALGKSGVPASALWGSRDTTTPPSGSEHIEKLVPGVETAIAEGPYHAITYSHPEIVADAIIRFGRHK